MRAGAVSKCEDFAVDFVTDWALERDLRAGAQAVSKCGDFAVDFATD
jgi:hypothetical protein